MNPRIACFFATKTEARFLAKKVKTDPRFLMVRTGIGPKAALQAARDTFDHYPIKEAWIFGFAAGTIQKLSSGTALLATQIGSLTTPKEKWIATDPSLQNKAMKICYTIHQKNVCGTLLTTDRIIHQSEEKINTGTQKNCIGLEMEGFSIALIAQERKISLMEVRWILDEAEEDLPEVENFIEESGKWKPLSTFFSLIRKPKLLLELPIFLWKVIRTSRATKQFLKEWIKTTRS